MRKLSSIELTVLGLAWLRGPCTIYAIMKELSLSESSFHKSRAGTAYSVANRLLKSGALEQVDDQIKISAKGAKELQNWITEPVPMADIAHSADLIRLRFFFLGVVDQHERLHFIDSAIAGTEVFQQKCECLLKENEKIGDYFGVLATLSSVMEVRTRIQWLRIVREWVENPIVNRQEWAKRVLESLGN